jgi:acetylornithine deacetylase/succinyl-diaminopimelate desuccinylase-like protein
VIPGMSSGSTDAAAAAPFGLPVYQVSGESSDVDDELGGAHGPDERIGVEAFAHGVDFYYRFLHALVPDG